MKENLSIPESEKIRRLHQSMVDKKWYALNKYNGKNTPLYFAIKSNNKEEVSKLVDDGWQLNHKGQYGYTPLSFAIKNKSNDEIIDLLINAGAAVEYRCLVEGVYTLCNERFEKLLNLAKLTDEQIINLISLAFINKNYKLTLLLTNYTEKDLSKAINKTNGIIPISYRFICTTESESEKQVKRTLYKTFLDRGLDLTIKSESGHTLLHEAVEQGDIDLIKLTPLKKLTVLDSENNNLILFALKCGKDDLAKWLIEKIKFINHKNKSGKNALMVKIESAESEEDILEFCSYLISHGIDLNAVDENLLDALIISKVKHFNKVANLLIDSGLNLEQSFNKLTCEQQFVCAILSKSLDMLSLLPYEQVNLQPIVQHKEHYSVKHSILHFAVKTLLDNVNEEGIIVVKKLLENGATFAKEEDSYFDYVYKIARLDEDLVIKLINAGLKVRRSYLDFSKNSRFDISDSLVYAPVLFIAASENKLKLAEFLLNEHTEFYSNKYGLYLLSLVIEHGLDSLTEIIIEKLDYKKCYEQLDSFDFVFPIDNKRKIFYCDPVYTAISLNKPNLVERLVDKIKQTNIVPLSKYLNFINQTSLDSFVKNKLIDIFTTRKLHESGEAFITACKNLDYALAENLLNKGIDINTTEIYNSTALTEVCLLYCTSTQSEDSEKYLTMIKWLAEKGADVNLYLSSQHSAIYYACYYKKEKLIDLLIELGVDIKQKESIVSTLEFYETIKTINSNATYLTLSNLIQKGADINFIDENDESQTCPIIYALKNHNYRFITFLVAAGADLTLSDSKGFNFFDYFIHDGNNFHLLIDEKLSVFENILPYADKFGAEALNAIVHANPYLFNYKYDTEILEKLIKAGLDVNASTPKGDTALYNACVVQREDMVEILIKAGANVNTIHNDYTHIVETRYDINGYETEKGFTSHRTLTPLMVCTLLARLKSLKLLIKNGANVNALDNENNNALTLLLGEDNFCICCAATNYYNEHKKVINYDVVKTLIDAGLDLDHKNNNGVSARELIKKSKNKDFINLLK